MFGGLDLKGSTGKKDPPKEDEAEPPKKEPSSAFSFLANSSASAAPAASGFSFLNSGSSSEPPPEAEPKVEASSAASSAFGFMAPAATTTETKEPKLAAQDEDAAPPPPPEAFDFLQQPTTSAQHETPSGSSSPVVTSDDLLSVAHNASNPSTGSGFVFANTAKRKTVKKRSRTAKIGAGATASALPPPSAMPPASGMSRAVSEDSTKLAEAATEASRRAEEFIHSKFKTESASVPPALETVKSEDDDVIIAAKAAAAEAKQLQQQQKKSSSFSNLFRGRSPTPKPVSNSTPAAAATSVDRLQQEQQEAKRAMAERQLQMQNETKKAPTPPVSSSFNLSSAPPEAPTFAPPTVTKQAYAPTKPVQSSFGLPDILSTPQTPTDKFNKILEEFETQVAANMDQLSRLNSQKRGFLEERTVVTARMQLAQSDAESCQNQQSAAAEAEDFDTAAQLSEMIQEYEQEQAKCKGTLDTIDATIVEIDKQVSTTVSTIESLFQGLGGSLQRFSESQNEDSDAVATIEKFSIISKQLSAEHERLQNDSKHLERDSELVAEERNELEKAISEQSGEYEKLRDQARSKLQETEAAIEALRKELDKKQREAAKLRTEAAGHDESVLRVRVKFARQITRVQTKEMSIKDHKEDWESEKKAYDAQKEAHDAQVEAHSEALVAKDKLANNLKMQIAESESFGAMVAEVIKEHGTEKMVSSDTKLQAEVAQHQADVRKCQVSLDSAKATVSSLEREIEFLVNDIPVFEEMKKAAAARRDFKAASKASKDIKEATARLTAAQCELQGEAASRQQSAEVDLKAARAKLDTAQENALAQEKESVVGIMAGWAETLKRLSATVNDLDDGLGVHAAAKYCLTAQIKALRAQGEAYGEKYGGWKELVADIEDTFDERDTTNPDQSPGNTELPAEKEKNDALQTELSRSETDSNATSANERMKQFLSATSRLKEVEEEVEAAAAAEDYEKAAVLDEELQQLLAMVENLNLTDSEMEEALAMEFVSSSQDQDDQGETLAPRQALESTEIFQVDNEPDLPQFPHDGEACEEVSLSNGEANVSAELSGTSSASVAGDIVDGAASDEGSQATPNELADAVDADQFLEDHGIEDLDEEVINGTNGTTEKTQSGEDMDDGGPDQTATANDGVED